MELSNKVVLSHTGMQGLQDLEVISLATVWAIFLEGSDKAPCECPFCLDRPSGENAYGVTRHVNGELNIGCYRFLLRDIEAVKEFFGSIG